MSLDGGPRSCIGRGTHQPELPDRERLAGTRRWPRLNARVDELRHFSISCDLRVLCPHLNEVKTCGILVELTRSARSNKAPD